MTTDDAMTTAPVHAVVIRRIPEVPNEPHFIEISVSNPGEFVRGLWWAVSGEFLGGPANDSDACGEWTDRGREYRTRVSDGNVVVYTHAWNACDDRRPLHPEVLAYLRSRGVGV